VLTDALTAVLLTVGYLTGRLRPIRAAVVHTRDAVIRRRGDRTDRELWALIDEITRRDTNRREADHDQNAIHETDDTEEPS